MWVTTNGYNYASATDMGAQERLPLPYVFLMKLLLHQTALKNLMVLKQAYWWPRIGSEAGTVPSRLRQTIFLPSAFHGKWMVRISFLCFASYKQKQHLSKPGFYWSFTSCAHKPPCCQVKRESASHCHRAFTCSDNLAARKKTPQGD